MSNVRASSSPELVPMSIDTINDSSLEGVATNVKLLLKLIQDHQEACDKGNDDRKAQRVAGIISILDNVKARMQKTLQKKPELRRCYTEMKAKPVVPRDREEEPQLVDDEKERLRRELHNGFAAQKQLGVMLSTLGKEKEIIARELARKVQELNEMEELVNGLRAQNEKLSAKVKAWAAEKQKKTGQGEARLNSALQEQNKCMSEQLFKSLESLKALKRKLNEVQDENAAMKAERKELTEVAAAGTARIRDLKHRITHHTEQPADMKEEMAALESIFRRLKSELRNKEDEH
ncbi:hypothetical protein Nepgr_003288 [Nepenthes gracilis]|uniref:Uncharacterized protein n=1 Tax=Nepenthes gracilis TaxID=150966 RepID=A0AAD3RZ77_NEPGR|nr:hypothetical protein Nepgr_003288 [Nepenthes gracilis]